MKAEKKSASGDSRMRTRDTDSMDTDLTPDDPQPQIGFRKAMTMDGKMLITIKLHVKDATMPAISRQ